VPLRLFFRAQAGRDSDQVRLWPSGSMKPGFKGQLSEFPVPSVTQPTRDHPNLL